MICQCLTVFELLENVHLSRQKTGSLISSTWILSNNRALAANCHREQTLAEYYPGLFSGDLRIALIVCCWQNWTAPTDITIIVLSPSMANCFRRGFRVETLLGQKLNLCYSFPNLFPTVSALKLHWLTVDSNYMFLLTLIVPLESGDNIVDLFGGLSFLGFTPPSSPFWITKTK